MEERLNKLREERAAREKARIEMLRELNLKKYPKSESQATSTSNSNTNKIAKSSSTSQVTKSTLAKTSLAKNCKNNFHVNGTTKRPISVPVTKRSDNAIAKTKVISKTALKSNETKDAKSDNHVPKPSVNKEKSDPYTRSAKTDTKIPVTSSKVTLKPDIIPETDKDTTQSDNKTDNVDKNEKKVLTEITKKEIINPKIFAKPELKSRKSLAVVPAFDKPKGNVKLTRKSILPKLPEATKSESVFERLYKPKYVAKKTTDEVSKLQTDSNFLKKMTKDASLITSGLNKRHTVFETTKTGNSKIPPRRSISAIHFKRISKSEIGNCIHRCSSIGDKLNKHDIETNEDETVNEDKVISAIRSERKKVTFMTPVPSNFNTPRPEELQARLKSWLQKRGKSLDSYHHLQCFGINHLKTPMGTPKHIPFNDQTPKNDVFDEENKENIALDSDSDDGSYVDTMNEPEDTLCSGDKIDTNNWRRASFDSESVGFNESTNFNETTITSADTLANVDELLIGALNDLTALLREGFDWQQSARWLRSIRDRFPHAPRGASYWECRAALEDSRGDLAASVHCWEQAIAAGTERSVVESNLDHLLDKFMQLKISPRSGASRQRDPKQLDVRNVFKSTIIRFAVQQAKLRRQSEHPATPVYTVTPVRRSARLTHCATSATSVTIATSATSATGRTPLRLCDTVRQAAAVAPHHHFTPNDNFVQTP